MVQIPWFGQCLTTAQKSTRVLSDYTEYYVLCIFQPPLTSVSGVGSVIETLKATEETLRRLASSARRRVFRLVKAAQYAYNAIICYCKGI